MKKFLVAAAGLVNSGLGAALLTSPVSAADLAARPYAKAPAPMMAAIYDWSGFYIGLNGGGGSSRNCWDLTANNGAAIVPAAREGCYDATGGLAGGQIGYRWQSSAWVFGVEAQGDWANLKGSSASVTAIIPFNNQTKIDGIGLFTGQVGYSWSSALLYVKGGAAVTHNNYSNYFTVNNAFGNAGTVFNTASDTRWGGTIGAGIEVGFAPSWSVGFEYNHLFMGTHNVAFPATAIAVSRADNIRENVDMATVRVNYRWGGPVIAKY